MYDKIHYKLKKKKISSKALNKMQVVYMIVVSFKLQEKKTNIRRKITIVGRKIPKPISGNIFVPGSARVMYLGSVGRLFSKFNENRHRLNYRRGT